MYLAKAIETKNNPSQGFNGKQSTAWKPVSLKPNQTEIELEDKGKKNKDKPTRSAKKGFFTRGKATILANANR